jgi:hypothetical protein
MWALKLLNATYDSIINHKKVRYKSKKDVQNLFGKNYRKLKKNNR